MATNPLLEHIDSSLCVKTLQKVQVAFTAYVNENYKTEEDRQFLYTITGEAEEPRDRQLREDIYETIRPALHDITPPAVHDLLQKEIRALFVDANEKAVTLVYSANSFLDYAERHYLGALRRTGILNLAFTPLERHSSAFYLYLKYKLENPGKYEEYEANYNKIMDYFNQVYRKISEVGSTQVHTDYIRPLEDKGL